MFEKINEYYKLFKGNFINQQKCLVCLDDIKIRTLNDYIFGCRLCYKCRNSFVRYDKVVKINNLEILVLYDYNEFMKQTLFRYKGQGDILLSYVFIMNHINLLKKKYSDCIFVFPPSNQIENVRRGFIHVEEIVKHLKLNYVIIFEKKYEYKQTKSHKRSAIKEVIALKSFDKIINKKVVIIDDIVTSGATISSCYELICNICEIEAIICIASSFHMSKNVE